MAPATRKFAAALQSPSKSMSAALYICPPLILKTISVQRDQSPSDSRKSRPPSISLPIFIPNFLRTSRVMNIYGMLLGSCTISDELRPAKGKAINSPEISCDPCFPDTSARPADKGPVTSKGTFRQLPSCSGPDAPEAFFTFAPNASIISEAPVSGLSSRVFSPVTVTGVSLSCAIKGSIILVKSPDSPT